VEKASLGQQAISRTAPVPPLVGRSDTYSLRQATSSRTMAAGGFMAWRLRSTMMQMPSDALFVADCALYPKCPLCVAHRAIGPRPRVSRLAGRPYRPCGTFGTF
jgi:hypothetical protein